MIDNMSQSEFNPNLPFRTRALLKLYRGKITVWDCSSCGASLRDQKIRFYPHSAGYRIGYNLRQWLYIRCPVCLIDYALWKLGVRKTALMVMHNRD